MAAAADCALLNSILCMLKSAVDVLGRLNLVESHVGKPNA